MIMGRQEETDWDYVALLVSDSIALKTSMQEKTLFGRTLTRQIMRSEKRVWENCKVLDGIPYEPSHPFYAALGGIWSNHTEAIERVIERLDYLGRKDDEWPDINIEYKNLYWIFEKMPIEVYKCYAIQELIMSLFGGLTFNPTIFKLASYVTTLDELYKKILREEEQKE